MENTFRGSFSTFMVSFFCMTMGLSQSLDFKHNYSHWDGLALYLQDNFKDSLSLWPERVMLQVANTQINADEPLFFKAYLTTGKLPKRYSKSKVLNLELLDDKGTLLKRQFHKIVDGMVEGQLELPKNSVSGNYAVKAYTRWSQNYGPDFIAQQKIQIGGLTDGGEKMDMVSGVSIIPEGGVLLSDHENRVIIRIPEQTHTSNGVARILDENRQEVAQVSFYSSELGTAIFKPQKNKLYKLELEDGTLCPIQKAEVDGFLLQVNNLDGDLAKIRITASTSASDSKVTLIGSAGGISYFKKKLDFSDGNVLDVELSKTSFPHGVFTLKLVDDLGTELASRPIWVAGERLQIQIEPLGFDTGNTLKTYKVKVTDHKNSPIKSQLSISANRYDPDAEIDLYQSVGSIFSEIFEEEKITDHRKESFLKDLDLLSSAGKMETEVLDNNIKFSFQKGLEILGHAYDLNNTLLSHTKIQIVATSEKDVWVGEAETDAQGLLKLEDIQIEGKAALVARTKGDDVKSRLVKIIPIEAMEKKRKVLMPYVPENPMELAGKQPVVHKETSNMEKSEKTIELDEVEVVEKGVERKKYTPSLYGIDVPPGRVAYQNFERPRSILQMLAELPGVVVGGAETLNPYAYILGANGPILWVLDGFPLSQAGGGTQMGTASSSSLSQIMAMANDRDIERIELLKGPEASIFGSRAAGGVFIIYTRNGSEQEHVRRKEGQLVFEGYTTAIDFEEYRQRLPRRKESKINLLYWNPNLETDENGEAIITVPVPSDYNSIKIEASTISLDGKMGSANIID
ncbi:TonB-dependent receptor plug domain-containing protein [Allomuricauda taeanensis]|uniref:TonB-dependent receptor n=1 Tax=Flagellimonas taeanensis TaxID=1005926 RepID=UPI002E7C07B4|nr:TonB-dependent receptor plug domain-containing protein [Allomuricauda taeanensis]MEE1963990.1 TonB-dependent receptor plug domain-containing protein [Allomuricauda taeanensis]